ncbi:MAG: mannitol dehydrogenase family protein [Janthinobacterium lividum]
MSTPTPILQFGTSRFLQAHADLFVSEAMATGEALGPITVVQTTASPDSAARVAALASGNGYPVRIRGLQDGERIDRTIHVRSVARALRTDRDWPEVLRIAVEEAQVILSNTGDSGYAPDPADDAGSPAPGLAPAGFPAKLAALLHARWQARPSAPLTVLPCELLPGNGTRLRELVRGVARAWHRPAAFVDYLATVVLWANSVVDRIVSEPILPVGAVAEPYALWAIERQAGLVLPCRHDAIVLADDLGPFERRKLHLLNLGHTLLAEHWLRAGSPPGRTVNEAMHDPEARGALEAAWAEEVLPVFDAEGEGDKARRYVDAVRDRFLNPFLAHRLSDIATSHARKKRLRLLPVLEAARRHGLVLAQPQLRAAMGEEERA